MTSRSPEEAEVLARFAWQYPLCQAQTMLEIERDVCGCDFGSTGWATKEEAEQIGTLLELAPGKRLLDLGAGSGWPGLYLASRSGCEVALADIPVEGMRIAAERAAADGLAGRAWAVASDGTALPFADASFDAIEHSDVLCCLEAKIAVLAECRRVARTGDFGVFGPPSFQATAELGSLPKRNVAKSLHMRCNMRCKMTASWRTKPSTLSSRPSTAACRTSEYHAGSIAIRHDTRPLHAAPPRSAGRR